jgi:hypothetical protein
LAGGGGARRGVGATVLSTGRCGRAAARGARAVLGARRAALGEASGRRCRHSGRRRGGSVGAWAAVLGGGGARRGVGDGGAGRFSGQPQRCRWLIPARVDLRNAKSEGRGRRRRGRRFYTPPPFSPGWELKPGLKGVFSPGLSPQPGLKG